MANLIIAQLGPDCPQILIESVGRQRPARSMRPESYTPYYKFAPVGEDGSTEPPPPTAGPHWASPRLRTRSPLPSTNEVGPTEAPPYLARMASTAAVTAPHDC